MIQLQHPFGKERTQSLSILVLGLGESGAAMVRWCINQGAKVSVADTRSENQLSENAKKYQQQVKDAGVSNIYLGDLSADLLSGIHLIAISPGLSPLQEPIQSFLANAAEKEIPVWGEIEFFAQALQALKDEQGYAGKVIAITGTNGKTTTTVCWQNNEQQEVNLHQSKT